MFQARSGIWSGSGRSPRNLLLKISVGFHVRELFLQTHHLVEIHLELVSGSQDLLKRVETSRRMTVLCDWSSTSKSNIVE